MATVFVAGCAALRAVSTAASTCASAIRAWSRKALPAAVNSMPCTLRLINWTPTSYSRSRIWRLREGCAVCSRFSAASVRLHGCRKIDCQLYWFVIEDRTEFKSCLGTAYSSIRSCHSFLTLVSAVWKPTVLNDGRCDGRPEHRTPEPPAM